MENKKDIPLLEIYGLHNLIQTAALISLLQEKNIISVEEMTSSYEETAKKIVNLVTQIKKDEV